MKRKLIWAVAAGPMMVALTVMAAPRGKGHGQGPGGPPPCADPIPAERQAQMLERHGAAGIDADSNGTLTCAEVQAFFAANPPPHQGGPQECTDPIPTERQTKLIERFGVKGIDADSNGTLTCAEVRAFFAANPPPQGGPRECTDPIPAQQQARMLERHGAAGIDADSNGTLTCAEVQAFFAANPPPQGGPQACTDPIPTERQTRLIERFGAEGIDADSNGTLTCAEVQAYFATHRPPGPPPGDGRGPRGPRGEARGRCGGGPPEDAASSSTTETKAATKSAERSKTGASTATKK